MTRRPSRHALAALSLLALSALGLAGSACSKSSSEGPPAPSSSAPLAAASASSARQAAAPASASAAPAEGAPTSWAGTYVAKVGVVEPPKNVKDKTWTEDPGSAAVGDGKLALAVTGAHGDTLGETSGALGDMTIAGVFDGKELRANLLPKDPKSEGAMTGFMVLTAEGGSALKGTLRVSGRDARIVREASVELAKK